MDIFRVVFCRKEHFGEGRGEVTKIKIISTKRYIMYTVINPVITLNNNVIV